jgi:hypothetical protein
LQSINKHECCKVKALQTKEKYEKEKTYISRIASLSSSPIVIVGTNQEKLGNAKWKRSWIENRERKKRILIHPQWGKGNYIQ